MTFTSGAGEVSPQRRGGVGREDRWEFTLGANYQLGADLDFDGGSTVATDDDFGFVLTTGYNFSDRLETSFGFQ